MIVFCQAFTMISPRNDLLLSFLIANRLKKCDSEHKILKVFQKAKHKTASS